MPKTAIMPKVANVDLAATFLSDYRLARITWETTFLMDKSYQVIHSIWIHRIELIDRLAGTDNIY